MKFIHNYIKVPLTEIGKKVTGKDFIWVNKFQILRLQKQKENVLHNKGKTTRQRSNLL